MKETNNIKDKLWINIAKAIAIIAVVIDHTKGRLYNANNIRYFTYFSVSLFILVSGYLTFQSYEKHRFKFKDAIIHFTKRIGIVYLLSTFVYQICHTNAFDLEKYISNVIYFNASPPLYYVSVYVQLMLVGYILYYIIKSPKGNCEKVLMVFIFVILALFSHWSINNTNMLKVFGGGGKLFGGTYIILFYIGMLLCKYNVFRNYNLMTLIVIFLLNCMCFVFVYYLKCTDGLGLDKVGVFGRGNNPPGITLMLMGLFMMFICFSFSYIIEKIPLVNKILVPLNYLGQHTLYIFIYHWLVMLCLDKLFFDNIVLKIIVYITFMLFIPICFEELSLLIQYKFNKICNEN